MSEIQIPKLKKLWWLRSTFIALHIIKAHWGLEVQLHPSLTLATSCSKWSTSRHSHFTSTKHSRYPKNRKLSRPWSHLNDLQKRKISWPCSRELNGDSSVIWLVAESLHEAHFPISLPLDGRIEKCCGKAYNIIWILKADDRHSNWIMYFIINL